MLFWTIMKVAFRSLMGSKLRSFLAMLGIIIGVGAVISMLALGGGAKSQVMQRITAMGTDLLIVRAGGDRRGGVRASGGQSLKLDDAKAILQVNGVGTIAPIVNGRAQVKYYSENANTTIMGAPLTYFDIRDFGLSRGRLMTSVEEDYCARVAVLGATVAEELFGTQDPLGETFRVKNINFRVIGVLKSKGDQGWFNPDDMVVIPYTTAMKQLLGQDYLSEVDVKAEEGADLTQVEDGISQLLRKRHRLRADAEDDFQVRNQAELIEMASSFTNTFTILLGGIAGISLVVGGIGIMNIMLVTVTERTREIGVRKAIGARDRDILRQFLLESVLISAVGGIIGIGLGCVAADMISRFTQFHTEIQTYSITLAIAVSASVGIFFGYYPARRAAKLDPIEALRYE